MMRTVTCSGRVVLVTAMGLSLVGQAAGLQKVREQRFEPVTLRGFGHVEAEAAWLKDSAGGELMCLTIRLENREKAQITHAKYMARLHRLGPARSVTVAGRSVVEAPDQGWVAALVRVREVRIVASASRHVLARYLTALDTGWEAKPRAKVPMVLDAWDGYGFRFYYRPWEVPKGVKWRDYRVLGEFDFARRLGRLGFVFWAKPDENDTGPALTNRHWWNWAARAAARRDLPIVVNTVRACPTWLANRYRSQVMAKMPQYCGSFHSIAEPHHDGLRHLSWCATDGADAEYAIVQQHVRTMSRWPTVVDFMEPNCELKHGEYDVFLEYGPAADASFRTFLRGRYRSLDVLSRRWYGAPKRLRSWDDVRVPELASFLGWGKQAVDLTGAWQIAYEPFAKGTSFEPHQLRQMHNNDIPTQPAPDSWYAPDFDDRAWPAIQAPGHDRMMFMQKRPAVLRRAFEVSRQWVSQGKRAWLYLWDLNYGKHRESWVRAVLNGKDVGKDTLQHAKPHWAAFEVTEALRPGRNLLAVRVPKGVLAYRVYISHRAPKQYPALGERLNARWVDFSDWRRWTRLDMCRRGMEMIRQVDPDRSIILASPDGYFAGIKRLCEQYGGRFHNTGHMSGFWNDFLPMLMRGSDLPFSLEPGGPAGTLDEFKAFMGRWLTEGVQAVHYFIHVGNIYWPDDIRRYFETIQPLVRTIGKVHPPKARVAVLLSNRANNLTGYPWGKDYNVNLPTGYWGWRFSDAMVGEYHVDAVTDLDFESGNADAYRVIVDTNTSVMDPRLVDRIEAWVRRGGIFVTMIQTGRHTPERPDSWPISRLTGYRVTGIDPHRADGSEGRTRAFTLTRGQPIFSPDDWPTDKNHYTNGLSLEKVAPECRDLMRWKEGPIAAGLRPLGKGYVLHMGLKFGAGRGGGGGNYLKLLRRILEWAEVVRIAAHADGVLFRHYVSNNGLYDVWTLWNRDRAKPVRTRLVWRDGPVPSWCIDVKTGKPVDLRVELTLEPLQTRIFLTSRNRITTAPLDWLRLQCNWWRGTRRPAHGRLKLPETPNMLDLTDDWAYRVLKEGTDDQSALAAADLNDSTWARRPLNCWAVGEELPSRRVLFRRTFTVPVGWRDGELTLWLRSFFAAPVMGKARYWLDGSGVPAGDGRYGLILPVDLAPGSRHCLAVEVRGEGQVCGVRGNTWLAFTPAPRETLDLAGQWTPSRNLMRWEKPVAVPGRVDGLMGVRRRVRLPGNWRDGQVYLYLKGGYAITGAIVNGRYIRRHHHNLGDVTFLNITPLLTFAAENEIEIVLPGGPGRREVQDVHLRLYGNREVPW